MDSLSAKVLFSLHYFSSPSTASMFTLTGFRAVSVHRIRLSSGDDALCINFSRSDFVYKPYIYEIALTRIHSHTSIPNVISGKTSSHSQSHLAELCNASFQIFDDRSIPNNFISELYDGVVSVKGSTVQFIFIKKLFIAFATDAKLCLPNIHIQLFQVSIFVQQTLIIRFLFTNWMHYNRTCTFGTLGTLKAISDRWAFRACRAWMRFRTFWTFRARCTSPTPWAFRTHRALGGRKHSQQKHE